MKRKLVKQGAATLMISLPAKWAKDHGLDKGDEISIEEDGENLTLKLDESVKKENKAVINVSKLSPLVNVAIISLYKKGVDELEIIFDKSEIAKDLQKRTIPELIGFEIIKQTSNSILVKDITGVNTQEVDDLIKRIFFILDSMIEELVVSIEKKQKMFPIIEIDASINKFANFCLRILNKKKYPDSTRTSQMYGIISQLEEIGDSYKSIANEIQENAKPDKLHIEILNLSRESLNLFSEILFKFEEEKVVDLAKRYETIKKKIKGKTILDFRLMQLNQEIIKLNNFLLVFAL